MSFILRSLWALLTTLPFATPVLADWPVDPASPLVLGETLGFGSHQEVVSTPDGATWVAWIDSPCFPILYVQRLSLEGVGFENGPLALDPQDNCISLSVTMRALEDNSVVVSAIGNDPLSSPVHRIASSGEELWSSNVVASDLTGSVQALLALSSGDALVAAKNSGQIEIGRYDAQGSRVWIPSTLFDTLGSSNMRVFALESDGNGGAYVLWDSPGAYTRRVYAMRVSSDGSPAWASPVLMVDIPPGSSRHTDPTALADGTGGLVLVWTQGAEQGVTPVPLRLQRLFADGTMAFDMSGSRISTAASRQFDAQIRQRVPGGDVYVVWRDGPFDDHVVRAQRMTLTGERVWGDTGSFVASLPGTASSFSFEWLESNIFGVSVSDATINTSTPSVEVHRVDTSGQVLSGPIQISGTAPAISVESASVDGGLAVVWQRQVNGFDREFVAQRVNADGTLGSVDSDGDGIANTIDNCTLISNEDQIDVDADGIGNLCDPDFNNDCVVNFVDYVSLTEMFLSDSSVHDLNVDGAVNFVDIALFQQYFLSPPGPSGVAASCNE